MINKKLFPIGYIIRVDDFIELQISDNSENLVFKLSENISEIKHKVVTTQQSEQFHINNEIIYKALKTCVLNILKLKEIQRYDLNNIKDFDRESLILNIFYILNKILYRRFYFCNTKAHDDIMFERNKYIDIIHGHLRLIDYNPMLIELNRLFKKLR